MTEPVGEQADIEIEITSGMVESGVAAWRDFHYGQREAEIVEAIYLAMEIERRAQANSLALATTRSM